MGQALSRRDSSIDFIKGVAIVLVVLIHCLPLQKIYADVLISAVPLFMMISGYLTFKSFERGKTLRGYYSIGTLGKIFKRIFVPFFTVSLIQFVVLLWFDKITFRGWTIVFTGTGPGSYYPWAHIQAWFLLPFIIWIINRLSLKQNILLFIGICAVLEILTCLLNVPVELYRYAFYRYLFAIVLGCLHAKYNFKITYLLVLLSVIGASFSAVSTYSNLSFEPFFTDMWPKHHWPYYFYSLLILLSLQSLYRNVKVNQKVKDLFVKLGQYSYEIFLCQMVVFSFFGHFGWVDGIEDIYLRGTIYVVATTVLSIAPIVIYKTYLKPLFCKRSTVSTRE